MTRLSAEGLTDINLRNHGRHTSNLERFLFVDRLEREVCRLQAENEELRGNNEALRRKLFNADAEKERAFIHGTEWRKKALDRQIALQDAQMDVDRLNRYCEEENKRLREGITRIAEELRLLNEKPLVE